MALMRVEGLPGEPLAAAAEFHARVLPKLRKELEAIAPPRNGEGDRPQGGGGAGEARSRAKLRVPLHHASHGPPPPSGEDHLTLLFAPADHTHRGWRHAVVQELAREYAPARVNAIESGEEQAIAAAAAYLSEAKGVTGQLLALDGKGAAPVLYEDR